MKDEPRPEAIHRRPEPVRIFSGARLNQNGTFVNPVHQTLSDLWIQEMRRRELPGILQRIPRKANNEIEISLRVIPYAIRDEPLLEKIRNRLEKGVREWIDTGAEPYENIARFREKYITPLEE